MSRKEKSSLLNRGDKSKNKSKNKRVREVKKGKEKHYILNREKKKLKDNMFMQGVISAVSLGMIIMYLVCFVVNLSGVVYAIEINSAALEQIEKNAEKVQQYEENDNGVMYVTLKNGRIVELVSSEDYTVCFIKGKETYWVQDDWTLLQAVSSDYGKNMLIGSRAYLIGLYIIFFFILTTYAEIEKFKILGNKLVVYSTRIFGLLTAVIFWFTYAYFV